MSSRVMDSVPSRDVTHLCPAYPRPHPLVSSHPGRQISCQGFAVLVFKSPFYLTVVPKHKSGDADGPGMPRRSYRGFR